MNYLSYMLLIGEILDEVDPEGLGVREDEDAICDISAVTLAAFNFGLSVEDASLLVLCGETLLSENPVSYLMN
jgi:hypothetical protein